MSKDGTDNKTPSLEQMLSDMSNTILRAIEGKGYWITKTLPITPLVFDREALAKTLHAQEKKTFGFGYDWENEKVVTKNQWLEMADAIIANQSFILKQPEGIGLEEIEGIIIRHTKGMTERQYGDRKHHCYVCREDLAQAIKARLIDGQ